MNILNDMEIDEVDGGTAGPAIATKIAQKIVPVIISIVSDFFED